MTELQYTILEASNDGLITFEEASMMLTMYESGSFGDKVKKAWESFKKWVKDIIDKITKKVAEFKEKIFGKKEAKVTVKSDPNKVKNLLKDVNNHLKPSEAFDESFWDKIKGKAAIAAIVGTVTGGITISAVEAHKHAGEIKDLILTMNDKLNSFKYFIQDSNVVKTDDKGTTTVEAKFPILSTILTPIISFAEKFILTLMVINLKNENKAYGAFKDAEFDSEIEKEKYDDWWKDYNDTADKVAILQNRCNDLLKNPNASKSDLDKMKADLDKAVAHLNDIFPLGTDKEMNDFLNSKSAEVEKARAQYDKVVIDNSLNLMRYAVVDMNRELMNAERAIKSKNYDQFMIHKKNTVGLDNFYKGIKETITKCLNKSVVKDDKTKRKILNVRRKCDGMVDNIIDRMMQLNEEASDIK